MSRFIARRSVLGLAVLALASAGCRSAFAPPPVARVSEAPKAQLAATVKRVAALRTGPDKLAHVVEELQPGAAVTASDQPVRGFRRVRTEAGRTGYVEEGALEVGAAVAAPAAPAPAPETAPEAAPSAATP